MPWHGRYDPTIKTGKTTLPPLEWEGLLVLNTPDEERAEPKKRRKKRRSNYIRDYRVDHAQMLKNFDAYHSDVKWNLYGTLSIHRKNTEWWMAKRAFDSWSSTLVSDDENDIVRWLRITEYRAPGANPRFHVFFKKPHFMS